MRFCFVFFLLFSIPAFSQSDSNLVKNAATADTVKELPENLKESFAKILKAPTESDSTASSTEDPELDMGVLIVNETRTRFGADFFENFYKLVSQANPNQSATVLVREEPFRMRMTRLLIKVNDVEVVQTLLRPGNSEAMEELIQNAANRVNYYIANYREVQQSLNGDDLTGSGIY